MNVGRCNVHCTKESWSVLPLLSDVKEVFNHTPHAVSPQLYDYYVMHV